MASARPPPNEMQSLHVEFGLPVEPKAYEQAKSGEKDSCQIYILHLNDRSLRVLGPIDDEFEELPYRNEQWDRYVEDEYEGDPNKQLHASHPESLRNTATIVYIENFFADGRDFAYYIIGRRNITAFLSGTFGMQTWNGPLMATPMLQYNREIMVEHEQDTAEKCKVIQANSPTERLKWKYLFDTATLAWGKLVIDPRKARRLRAKNAAVLRFRGEAVNRETDDN